MRYFVICALLFFITISGCATVPLTGRRQLSIVPRQELAAMSRDSLDQVLSEVPVSRDARAREELQRVGDKLSCAAVKLPGNPSPGEKWNFLLLQSDELNAFGMPGGTIAVYTGILKAAGSESELAAVVAHEMAHEIANHSGERLSQQLLAQLGEASLSAVLAKSPAQARNLAMTAYGAGARFGVILPYSRGHESEADRISLTLMAMAGYDPAASLCFWEKMRSMNRRGAIEFISTHPSTARRIADIKRWLPEARRYQEK